VYRQPLPANDNDLALMRRLDELFTAWPPSSCPCCGLPPQSPAQSIVNVVRWDENPKWE